MLLITKDAEGEFWPWDVAQFNGARETLVFWGIVVLQTNLKKKKKKKLPFKCIANIIFDLENRIKSVPGTEAIKDGSHCCNGGIGKVSFVHVIWNILISFCPLHNICWNDVFNFSLYKKCFEIYQIIFYIIGDADRQLPKSF